MARMFVSTWPLFLGLLLLQMGNALQGTLLSVRADGAGISNELFGFISAGYFAGFLIGSYLTPKLIARVGHIRVFAALASLASACFILYAIWTNAGYWFVLRVLVGFCFSGVYIVAESWINDASTNETRGQALSAYYIIMMFGIVAGQLSLNLGDPTSFELFIVISVLVSLSFAPILLSVSPAPVYDSAEAMTLRDLYRASPLGFVGQLILGGFFGAMFGMSAFYGARVELTPFELSTFLSALYVGAVLFQAPIGWISDRMDRRALITILCLACAGACVLAAMFAGLSFGVVGDGFELLALYPLALVVGGLGNPIYPLLVAHTNDFLPNSRMAAASSGLVLLNGVGALSGPLLVGVAMSAIGDEGFWLFMAASLVSIAAYALYRATQRPTVDEQGPIAPYTPRGAVVAAEMAQEFVVEQIEAAVDEEPSEDEEDADERASREAVDHD